MKILSIGNSFSQDAHRWLHSIAKVDNYELDTVNLNIGGCSLEQHWFNFTNDIPDYEMEGNNGEFVRKTSILQALESDKFDVVTVQQASHFSGRPQSFFPFLTNLVEVIRKKQPDAKIYFHKTWSYNKDSSHTAFAEYNCDRKEMYRRISDCCIMASEIINAKIIPSGEMIQKLSENTKEFNCEADGISLYRDGFHLSLDYGRFAAAAVWYKTLTGRKIDAKKVATIDEQFDSKLIEVILEQLETIEV